MKLSSLLSRWLVVLAFLSLWAGRVAAQVEDAPVGVAVKIYARGQAWYDDSYDYASLSVFGTFLESSPGANNGYALNEAYAGYVEDFPSVVLGNGGYVRVEPSKTYSVYASAYNVYGCELNIVAPPGYRVVMDNRARSRETFEDNVCVIFQLLPIGAKHPGLAGMSTTIASSEIEWRMSLGSLRNGTSAGELALIDTGMRSDWAPVFTPSMLFYESTSSEISVTHVGYTIRQVFANQMAVDVVATSSSSYEIRCYHPSQVQGSLWLKTFNGQPFILYRIEQGATATTINFTKEVRNTDASNLNAPVSRREFMSLARGGSWPTHTWTRSDWTVENQTALSQAVVVSSGTSSSRSEAIALSAPGASTNTINVTRNYGVPMFNGQSTIGEIVASETAGTGTGLTTSFSYYTDPSQFGSLGYLKSATLPGGGWVAYDYYDADVASGYRGGRVKHRYRPYVTAPTTATLNVSQGEVAYYEYVNDEFDVPTRLSLEQTSINGTMVAKATTSYSTLTANGYLNSITQATRTEFSSASQSLQTITRSYPENTGDSLVRGQPYSIALPDGVKRCFEYQYGTWDGTTFAAGPNYLGFSNNSNAARLSVIVGSSYSSAGVLCPSLDGYQVDTVYLVAGKSTMESTIR